MRKLFWAIFGLWLCGLPGAVRADTLALTDGTTLAGDIISFNDAGIIFRLADDKYSERIPWTKFSQDALKQLAKNPKIKPSVEPFIEIPPSERAKKEPVSVHDVSRLELPPKQSLFGALFSSSVGLSLLLLIYVANIYAGFEIAMARARPIPLVMGVSAVLPILGPVIFLAMPVRAVAAAPAGPQPAAGPHAYTVPGVQPAAGGGIHITEASWQSGAPAAPGIQPQIFQRGQFMFNRRFFETKFSGFFSIIRREPEKNQILVVKTGRANMEVERITRITANEAHFEIGQGTQKQEIMVPFADIVEVQLAPKA